MEHSRYLPQVKNQYENLPYPLRNPEDEKKRLSTTYLDSLDRINYYCFSGKKNFSKGFRALVAGGGTGDASIFLAEQLRHTDAEILHVDLSAASIEIAKQRAAMRRLDNIKWIQNSLLDIPKLDIGRFDYINCSGMLHHLANPDEGLAILSGVLKDNGAVGIMVYGQYGRTAVYQIQELMRLINRDNPDSQSKIKRCRSMLRDLPNTNWLKVSANHYDIMSPSTINNDNEIYDIFLHSQDRAYTIPQLYSFAEGSGLHIIQLFPTGEPEGMKLYDPASYLKDKELLEVVSQLDLPSQQAIAELMRGSITRHIFYAARSIPHLPKLDDLENIPFLDISYNEQRYLELREIVFSSRDRVSIANERGQKLFEFRKTPNAEGIFKYLDGKKSTKEIFDSILASPTARKTRPTYQSLLSEFKEIFNALRVHNSIYLRDPAVTAFRTTEEMHRSVTQLWST